jgi:hypothetical protein
MSNSLTDQAIRFLEELGLSMVPSRGLEKKPCVQWSRFQKQLPTVKQLREWSGPVTPDRWGFVTGQLSERVVVDFDGERGREWMRKWKIKPHLRTGSGGFHCHLLHPGWRVPTLNAKSGKVSWPWPGVDIRGDGGFAIVLGRNSNGPYEQLRELVPDRFEVLPEEVRTFLRNNSVKERMAPTWPVPFQRRIQPGRSSVDLERLVRKALEMASRDGRNNAGFWLACQLRDNGYEMGDAYFAMRDYCSQVRSINAKGNREGYTQAEITASLSQAYSLTPRDPWERGKRLPHGDAAAAAALSREPGRRSTVDSAPGKKMLDQRESADDSQSIDLYVVHTGEPLVGPTGEPLSRAGFSRVPREVSSDRRLKHRDVRVYAVLAASCWQGTVANVGKRLIAKHAPCAERLVVASLKRLEGTGHIKKLPVRRGQRGLYHLVSPIFGQKQRADVQEMITTPDGRRRLVTVRKEQGIA